MGAGFDTRCYGDLKKSNLKFFELLSEWKGRCSAMANVRETWTLVIVALNLYTKGVDPKLDFFYLISPYSNYSYFV